MNLIQQFGVDKVLFIAQIINFLIVFYILKRYLYKPVLEILKTRAELVKKGIKDAEEAKLLYEKAAEHEKKIIGRAQTESKKIIDLAKRQSAEMIKANETIIKQQADKILKEAREQIAFDTLETERRLSAHVSQLAVNFLQKSLEDVFSEKEQEIIMRNAIKNIKGQID